MEAHKVATPNNSGNRATRPRERAAATTTEVSSPTDTVRPRYGKTGPPVPTTNGHMQVDGSVSTSTSLQQQQHRQQQLTTAPPPVDVNALVRTAARQVSRSSQVVVVVVFYLLMRALSICLRSRPTDNHSKTDCCGSLLYKQRHAAPHTGRSMSLCAVCSTAARSFIARCVPATGQAARATTRSAARPARRRG
jgi:hypothetical protein